MTRPIRKDQDPLDLIVERVSYVKDNVKTLAPVEVELEMRDLLGLIGEARVSRARLRLRLERIGEILHTNRGNDPASVIGNIAAVIRE